MGKEHKCPLQELPDGTYRCAISGAVHRCGRECTKVFEGSEGLVCFLTGQCLGSQLVLHRPFNREGRSQSHYVMRQRGSGKRRSSGSIDVSSNKSMSFIHKALEQILKSPKREQLQKFYMNRFISEALKAARKHSGRLLDISKTIKAITQNHIMHLLPAADNIRTIDTLSENPATVGYRHTLT